LRKVEPKQLLEKVVQNGFALLFSKVDFLKVDFLKTRFCSTFFKSRFLYLHNINAKRNKKT
jgi:hypothetical protein